MLTKFCQRTVWTVFGEYRARITPWLLVKRIIRADRRVNVMSGKLRRTIFLVIIVRHDINRTIICRYFVRTRFTGGALVRGASGDFQKKCVLGEFSLISWKSIENQCEITISPLKTGRCPRMSSRHHPHSLAHMNDSKVPTNLNPFLPAASRHGQV